MSFFDEARSILSKKIRFDCPKCRTHLAMGRESAGKLFRCPRCKSLVRAPRPAQNSGKKGKAELVAADAQKYFQAKAQKKVARHEITKALVMAMSDGILTDKESRALIELARQHGLSEGDLEKAKIQYAKTVYREVVKDEVATPEEHQMLQEACRELGVPERSVIRNKQKYEKMRGWGALLAGEVPIMSEFSTALERGEVCHYENRGTLLEYQYGHLAKPNEQGQSGRGVSTTEKGNFLVTSKRILLKGEKKTVSIPLSKVAHVDAYSDSIGIHRSDRVRPIFMDPGEIGYVSRLIRTICRLGKAG